MEIAKVLTEQEAAEINERGEVNMRHGVGDILYSVQPHAKLGIDVSEADVTLDVTEIYCSYLEIADGGAKAIIYPVAPPVGHIFLVRNKDADTAVTVKVSGKTGASAAAGKVTVMVADGTDIVALGELATIA